MHKYAPEMTLEMTLDMNLDMTLDMTLDLDLDTDLDMTQSLDLGTDLKANETLHHGGGNLPTCASVSIVEARAVFLKRCACKASRPCNTRRAGEPGAEQR
jgi:hypothetical protein